MAQMNDMESTFEAQRVTTAKIIRADGQEVELINRLPNGSRESLQLSVDRMIDFVWTHQDRPDDGYVSLSGLKTDREYPKLDLSTALESMGLMQLRYSEAYISAYLTERGYDLAEQIVREGKFLGEIATQVQETLERPQSAHTLEVQKYLHENEPKDSEREPGTKVSTIVKELTKSRRSGITAYRVWQAIDVLDQLGVIEIKLREGSDDLRKSTVHLCSPRSR